MSQATQPVKPESDITDFDEHGCKVGLETWDGEKCVPVEAPPAGNEGSEGDVSTQGRSGASEGDSPTEGAPIPAVPDDGKKDVDEHGCYIGAETWSEEQQMCIPNRDETEESVGEDAEGETGESTQPETASALIERGKSLLKFKHDRDVERTRQERRHPA